MIKIKRERARAGGRKLLDKKRHTNERDKKRETKERQKDRERELEKVTESKRER